MLVSRGKERGGAVKCKGGQTYMVTEDNLIMCGSYTMQYTGNIL